jgi:hypothetical protein
MSYVTYKGIPSSRLTIERSIELQKWILDPSSRPYDTEKEQKLIARSAAGTKVEKRLTVEKALELQQKILGNL